MNKIKTNKFFIEEFGYKYCIKTSDKSKVRMMRFGWKVKMNILSFNKIFKFIFRTNSISITIKSFNFDEKQYAIELLELLKEEI